MNDSIKAAILEEIAEDEYPNQSLSNEYQSTLQHLLDFIESGDKGDLICASVHYGRVQDYYEAQGIEYVDLSHRIETIVDKDKHVKTLAERV